MSCRRRLISALLILSICGQEALYAAPSWWPPWGKKSDQVNCEEELDPATLPDSMPERPELSQIDALRMLHEDVPVLLRERSIVDKNPPWTRLLNEYLWPFMRSESKELAVAIVGPGNSGKSTFFNTIPRVYYQTLDLNQTQPLPNLEVSQVKFSAGHTARPVFLMNNKMTRFKNRLELRFGTLDGWTDSSSSTRAGNPIFYPVDNFFKNVIFIDTPSFDIVGRRDIADQVFVWADIIFYVFSGSNYKNDLNIQIMREKFQEIGAHQVALVYRVNESIPPEEAFEHFHEIAHDIFPNATDDATTRLPRAIVGTYIMTESDKVTTKEAPPKFIALNHSPELPSLLADFDARYDYYRLGALEKSLTDVLDGVSDSLKLLQRNQEEVDLTESMFNLLLTQTVKDVIGVFPYHRLSGELEEMWRARIHGFRSLARWIGQPHRQFRRRRPDISLNKLAIQDLESYSNSVVEKSVSNFMLAASRGKIEIRTEMPELKEFLAELEEFRSAHRLRGDQRPYVKKVGDQWYEVDIYISRIPEVQAKMNEYMDRDWVKATQQIKEEANASLREQVTQMQSELHQIATMQVKRQKITSRTMQTIYPLMAVVPFIAAVTYVTYSPDVHLLEFRGLLSIISSMVWANIMVKLDDASIRQAWSGVIDQWYGNRQGPRLMDILKRKLRFKTSPTVNPQSAWAIERLQMAVETLSQRGTPLISTDRKMMDIVPYDEEPPAEPNGSSGK